MALTKETATHTWYTTDEGLWLTEDGKVVPDGDPSAAFLFAAAGSQVSVDDAEKYGLVKGTKASQPAPEDVVDGDQPNPDADLKAAEWVALAEAAKDTDELEALTKRYAESGAKFKTADDAIDKKTDALTAG